MKTIKLENLKSLEEFKKELSTLKDADMFILEDEDFNKFAVSTIKYLDLLNRMIKANPSNQEGIFISVDQVSVSNITNEEFEQIKKSVIDALEKKFRPSVKYRLDQS